MLVLSNTVLQPNKKAFRLPSRWRGSRLLHAELVLPWPIKLRQARTSNYRRVHSREITRLCPLARGCPNFFGQGSRIDRVSDHCMPWCVHRVFCRWSFELLCYRTRTRRDSNSCVDNGFFSCFEFGHVVLNLFSPLPTRSPPRKYAWHQPTSIVDLSAREPCRFFFRKAGQLWTLNKQPQPIITSRREEKHPNKRQTNDQTKSFSAVCRRSVLSAPRSRSRPALQRRDFP